MSTCRVDVVVVGGRVAGLWILDTLRAGGWSALLLEAGELGGGQTGHSHVYLHRGHLYRKEARTGTLVRELQLAATLWDEWLADNEPHYERIPVPHEEGLFGFMSEALAAESEALWDSLGLASRRTSPPPLMQGSPMQVVRSVSARCLNAQWLTSALAAGNQEAILGIDGIDALRRSWTGIEAIDVRLDGRPLELRCAAVVLAAGSGNKGLVERVAPRAATTAHDRLSHMLVLRGRSDVLPPVTGIFELSRDDALFIVSRTIPEQQSTVWLVSDASRNTETAAWTRYVGAEIDEVFPLLRSRREELFWGVYKAPKAEVMHARSGERLVGSPVVEPVLPNVWAVWPMKLTLAPLAALTVVGEIEDHFEERTPLDQPSVAVPSRPAVATETWERRTRIRGSNSMGLCACDDGEQR